MRFIHIADIHASRERLPQTLHILNTLTERCKQGDIDFILFAGDFWDSTITATKGSGFSDIISAIRELEKHSLLLFIYGTPHHEPNGSLDAFQSERCKVVTDMATGVVCGAEIVCIPQPRRSNYISDSAKKTDELINRHISDFINTNKKFNSKLFSHRIVVYHGEVKGVIYQNGISASSPTAIPKELLQSLNADYYALGHIHMPQEVFKNAWYSGSACPKDFGETHDGCYNLVTIENEVTKVERVSFGLPTYTTISLDSPHFPFTKETSYKNQNLRVQFLCTKEERNSLNLKQIADEIKERTNAVSVKLEPNVVESESVPRSEVSKRKSIVEKMTEYAKEKGIKIPKHAKELLQDIQDNTLIKLAYPQHSFELLSLSLRGAIGIRNGQHKEDYEINFEKFEDGVVCLCGECGKGKSSLLENCHPYPCMLTRDGTLKEHFYLKDSHRILVYKDENGLYYKISMLIDGKTATGKTSYFVETSTDRESWKPLPEVDGSLKSYEDWVNGTFGSIDVFLRTAFFAKEQTKNATDISATTKSERMELLSKLAGTEHLKEVSVIAREQRKGVEKSAEKIENEIDSYSRFEETIKQNEQDIISWKNELTGQEQYIFILEKEVAELKAKDAEYQKVKAVSEANNALYNQYKKEFDETNLLYEKFDAVVSDRTVYDKLDKCKSVITDNASHIEEFMFAIEAKEKEIDSVSEEVCLLNKNIAQYKVELAKIETNEMSCRGQVVNIADTCPTCGAPLSEHKKAELQKHISKSQSELEKILKEKESKQEILERAEALLKEKDTVTQLKDELFALKENLANVQSESEDCSEYIKSLDDVYTEYSYEDAVEEHQKLSDELKELQGKMDELVDTATVEDVSDKLKEKEDRLKSELNRKSDLAATIKSAEKENERYRKELETVADKKKEMKELSEKINAYLFIEDAFSNNGIPAIELRESAPEIADIANKILKDSYGNKFEIRFGSTSELKAKRKANEDFNILVYDSENGDEKTIDLVSSGERIWIKQALFYAFSIVQMNRTGFNFRTRLIDESDGSLDGGLRPKYLNMVTSAHKYASARVTLMITHSQEIKDIAGQILEI